MMDESYGYGYGSPEIGHRGLVAGWGQGYKPAVSGYSINPDNCTCNNGTFANSDCCNLARAALCQISSQYCSASCDTLQALIQSNCTLFTTMSNGQPDPVRCCAQCVNGTWTGSCTQSEAACNCSSGGGCTGTGPCTCAGGGSGTCVNGVCTNCPTGTSNTTVILLAGVAAAGLLGVVLAMEGAKGKTITIARPG